jgi:hypothetical protein
MDALSRTLRTSRSHVQHWHLRVIGSTRVLDESTSGFLARSVLDMDVREVAHCCAWMVSTSDRDRLRLGGNMLARRDILAVILFWVEVYMGKGTMQGEWRKERVPRLDKGRGGLWVVGKRSRLDALRCLGQHSSIRHGYACNADADE